MNRGDKTLRQFRIYAQIKQVLINNWQVSYFWWGLSTSVDIRQHGCVRIIEHYGFGPHIAVGYIPSVKIHNFKSQKS